MPEPHSIAAVPSDKPAKPYPEFPLFPHQTRRWAKKIRGQLHYFGAWADGPDAALARYEAQKDALHAGRKPRDTSAGVTIKELCNDFLNAKRSLVETGELTSRSWEDYKAAAELIVAHFGKGRLVADLDPEDFSGLRAKMGRRWGPVTIGSVIQRMRVIFKYAFDKRLIQAPVCYGPDFKRPAKKTLRVNKARRGVKLFAAEEVRRLLDEAGPSFKAMIFLAINAGFGNADCGHLPYSAVDLDRGMIDFPRPKTGIPRRCPLWPETVEAIRVALARRPEPKNIADADLVFITKRGQSWAKETSDNPVSKEFRKLLDALGINGHRNFYTLRHTFRTVADEAKDQPAVDFVMGHEDQRMAALYRETISDARLRVVAEHVRTWLFGVEKSQ
jgi:integrase